MQGKKAVAVFFFSSLFLTILFFTALYLYDPLKLYHKPLKKKYQNRIHSNMREQAAGVINNWEFDSLILGTSIMENSSADEASQKLGGRFVNLSLEGSNYFERHIVLRYALSKKKIDRVIYSLDHLGVVSREGHPTFPVDQWDFLYDDNRFDDFRIYLNNKYMKCLRSFSSSDKCLGRDTGLDRPNAWYMDPFHAARYGGLEKWFQASNTVQIKEVFQAILDTINQIKAGKEIPLEAMEQKMHNVKMYLDETILSPVSRYPDTEFDLILPPYSRIFFAIEAQYDKPMFQLYRESIRYLVSMSQKYPNMKLYGWGDHDFLDDIANYKDLYHYSYEINSWMLDAIKKGEGLLTPESVEGYLHIISEKALQYDLLELGEKIDAYLKKSANPKQK